MTDATPGMIGMARRIAADAYRGASMPKYAASIETGELDDVAVRCALAAIIETQRLCAELVEWMGDDDPRFAERAATAIRAGQHYGKGTDQ